MFFEFSPRKEGGLPHYPPPLLTTPLPIYTFLWTQTDRLPSILNKLNLAFTIFSVCIWLDRQSEGGK